MNIKELILEIEKLSQKRIVIVGPPGSGKSTLARELSEKLALPYIEADAYFWKENGEHVSESELLNLVSKKINQTPIWIFEGHFKTCHSVVLKDATMVVEISRNFWLSFLDYALRELKRDDLNLKQKIDQVLFVPKNYERILKTREEALRNYQGKRIKI